MAEHKQKEKGGRMAGFTLIEVLLSMLVASLVLVGVIQALLYLTAMSSTSRNRSLVFGDVQMATERISGTALNDLSTAFPDNQPLSASFVTNVLGGYKAPNESVVVSYPGGTSSNPREVLVNGQWSENGRVMNVALRTFRRG